MDYHLSKDYLETLKNHIHNIENYGISVKGCTPAHTSLFLDSANSFVDAKLYDIVGALNSLNIVTANCCENINNSNKMLITIFSTLYSLDKFRQILGKKIKYKDKDVEDNMHQFYFNIDDRLLLLFLLLKYKRKLDKKIDKL